MQIMQIIRAAQNAMFKKWKKIPSKNCCQLSHHLSHNEYCRHLMTHRYDISIVK